MSLQFIIDGYNVTRHPLFLNSQGKNKDAGTLLLEIIRTKKLCGSLKNNVTVVLDGYPQAQNQDNHFLNFKVVYSQDLSADDLIKHKVDDFRGNRKNIIVVSDDREIVSYAKQAGARVLSVEDFLGKDPALNKRARQDKRLEEKNTLKQELNYTQVDKINEELKRLWLKDVKKK